MTSSLWHTENGSKPLLHKIDNYRSITHGPKTGEIMRKFEGSPQVGNIGESRLEVVGRSQRGVHRKRARKLSTDRGEGLQVE